MQLQAQKMNGVMPKELMYECVGCNSLIPVKELLKLPVNTIIEAYFKEFRS